MFRFTIIDYSTSPPTNTEIDEPVGWDAVPVRLKRDAIWHGFFEFFDDSLTDIEFYGEAYRILKTLFDTYGIEAKADLLVETQCGDTGEYEFLYQGRFAFKRSKFFCGKDCYTAMGLEANDCLMKFRNRYEQKADLNEYTTSDMLCINPTEVQVRFINFSSQINFIGSAFPSLMPGDKFTITGSQFNNREFTVVTSNVYMGSTETTVAEFVETEGTEYEFVDCVVCFDVLELPDYAGLGVDVLLPGKKILSSGKVVGTESNYDIVFDTDFAGQGNIVGPPNNGTLNATSAFNLVRQYDDFNSLSNTDAAVWCTHGTCPPASLPQSFEFNANSQIKCAGELKINLRIKGVYNDNYESEVLPPSSLFFIDLRKGTSAPTTIITSYLHYYSKSQFGTDNISVDWQLNDYVVSLAAGEKLWLVCGVNLALGVGSGSGVGSHKFTVHSQDCFLDIEIQSQCLPTPAKSYFINEVFSRLAEKYTNDCLRVYSDYFGRTDSQPYSTATNGCGSNEVLTNGLLLRGVALSDETNPNLKVSFKETFEAMKAIHNVGMGIENDDQRMGYKCIRIEPYKHFYKDDVLMVCEYPELVTRQTKTSYINMIKVGYEKWEAEETNGLFDLFGKREYKTRISAQRGSYEQVCKFIASDYALEVTRRRYGITSKDWKYDNDTFIVCVQKGLLLTCVSFIETDAVSGLNNLLNIGYAGTGVFEEGDSITIEGSASNNLTFTIDAIIVLPFAQPETILVLSGNSVTDESCVNIRVTNNTRPLITSEVYDVSVPATIQNVLLPETAFNLRITPIRNLLRHYPSIAESLARNDDTNLYFSDGSGNIKAVINLAANHSCVQENDKMLSESDTITPNDFAPTFDKKPIVQNETIEFDYPVTFAQFGNIIDNPYGLIGFTCQDGIAQYGWIEDFKYQPRTGIAEFILKPKIES